MKSMAHKAGPIISAEDENRVEGWLQKRGAVGLLKGAKQRFFSLVENQLSSELRYYTTDAKTDLKGQINLNDVMELRDGKDLNFFIVVKKDQRVYELKAPNMGAKRRWLKNISAKSDVPITTIEEGADGSEKSNRKGAHGARDDDGIVLQGSLLKLSGGSYGEAKRYQRRFFRLRNDDVAQVLQYFDDDRKGRAKLSGGGSSAVPVGLRSVIPKKSLIGSRHGLAGAIRAKKYRLARAWRDFL